MKPEKDYAIKILEEVELDLARIKKDADNILKEVSEKLENAETYP